MVAAFERHSMGGSTAEPFYRSRARCPDTVGGAEIGSFCNSPELVSCESP